MSLVLRTLLSPALLTLLGLHLELSRVQICRQPWQFFFLLLLWRAFSTGNRTTFRVGLRPFLQGTRQFWPSLPPYYNSWFLLISKQENCTKNLTRIKKLIEKILK